MSPIAPGKTGSHANELAHGIKGVAANLGMNDLSDAAAKLESWDGGEATEAWQPLLDQFEMCLNTVLQAIEHLEQGVNKTVTVVPDKDIAAIDKQKLSKLLKALESSLETEAEKFGRVLVKGMIKGGVLAK